jgi:hypothetical protein
MPAATAGPLDDFVDAMESGVDKDPRCLHHRQSVELR